MAGRTSPACVARVTTVHQSAAALDPCAARCFLRGQGTRARHWRQRVRSRESRGASATHAGLLARRRQPHRTRKQFGQEGVAPACVARVTTVHQSATALDPCDARCFLRGGGTRARHWRQLVRSRESRGARATHAGLLARRRHPHRTGKQFGQEGVAPACVARVTTVHQSATALDPCDARCFLRGGGTRARHWRQLVRSRESRGARATHAGLLARRRHPHRTGKQFGQEGVANQFYLLCLCCIQQHLLIHTLNNIIIKGDNCLGWYD